MIKVLLTLSASSRALQFVHKMFIATEKKMEVENVMHQQREYTENNDDNMKTCIGTLE